MLDAPNACPDAGADPGLVNAAPPTGTQLQMGNDLSIRGVTSDGYVIYSDDAALQLHAMPIAGGATLDLGSLGAKFWVVVSGSVVLVWSNVTAANVGALASWSVATGLHAISTASLGLVATASDANVLYVDHVNANAQSGDVYAANIDGSNATQLVSAAIVDGCLPALGFVGAYAIASHCDVPFTSTPVATISAFTLASWARSDLATNAENYWTSSSATEILVSTSAGIQVVPLGGGAPMAVDATGFLGVLTADGKSALYSTKSHALRRSIISPPAPATLVPSGFGGFWGLSPDQQWVLYFANVGSGGGDIYLTSAMSAGTPMTLSTLPTGAFRGDAFTANTSHVLYSTALDPCTDVGVFQSLAIGTMSPQVLGQRSWSNWALGGSKVVFNDNYFATGELRFGRADIEWVDLAQGTTPTRIADRADAVIGLSPAGDQLLYVWSAQPGPLSGLYAMPLK
jgi:hypothetical protein